MAETYISPDDNIQAIIDASNTGDALIFNPGIYRLESTLRLKGNRSYIGRGDKETVFAEVRLPISLYRRVILWLKRHVLRKPERPPTIKVTPMILIEGENVYIENFTVFGSGTCIQVTPPHKPYHDQVGMTL